MVDIAGSIRASNRLIPRASELAAQNLSMDTRRQQNNLASRQESRLDAEAGRRQSMFETDENQRKAQQIYAGVLQVEQNPGLLPSFVDSLKQMGELDPTYQGGMSAEELSELKLGLEMQLGGAPRGPEDPANLRFFNQMTAGMSPEDVERARRINLGLESRAGQARTTDIGGVPTLVGVGSDGQPYSVPISSLPEEVRAAFSLSEASTAGTEAAETAAIPDRMWTEAQTQAELDAPARESQVRDSIANIDNVLDLTSQALGNVDWLTTGPVGVVLEHFAGTSAADLQATVDTIVANLSFDRLQQMRDSSKTGGALGQVSERELTLLGSAVAALRNSQSPAQQIANLRRVYDHYNRMRQKMVDQLPSVDEVPDTAEAPVPTQTATGPNGEKIGLVNGQWVPL